MNMLVQNKEQITTFLEHQSRTPVLLNSADLSLYVFEVSSFLCLRL